MKTQRHLAARRRRGARAALLGAALALGGCADMNIPDYNRPPLDNLRDNPNRTLVNAAAVGVLASSRADAVDFARRLGILGREGYYLDPNETRFVTELVRGTIDPSSFAGGGLWFNRYSSIRLSNTILEALPRVPEAQMTDAEKEGVRGWAKTWQAVDFMAIAATRELAPVDVGSEPTAEPAPMVPRAQVYAHARKLLDEGAVHLAAAGASFSFNPTTGLTQFGLGTPAEFRKVNRGLRARLDVLTGDHAAALAALAGSFIATPAAPTLADLHRGAYYPYSTGSGDATNLLATSSIQVADTLLKTHAELRANGQRDARYVRKVGPRAGGVLPQLGVSSGLAFRHYNQEPFFGSGGTSSPIPVLRNEELILLRAEARWKTGDLAGATEDLNYVRVHSGGLAPHPDLTEENFGDAVLHERRYSLLLEGGHRWLDLRRMGMLATLNDYPRAGDRSAPALPIPASECQGRGGGTQGC